MPDECKSVIPYTSYPNEPLGLYNESDFVNVTTAVWTAALSCNDTDAIILGGCYAIYPRCFNGVTVPLCQQSCLGRYHT